MKYKIDEPIKSLAGKALKIKDLGEDGKEIEKELTFAEAIGGLVLSDEATSSHNTTAEDKRKAFGIANKVYEQTGAELSADEITFIIAKAGRISSTFLFGRLEELLDPKGAEKKDE